MKLPAYPKYKPSGVEWLGDVPEHWGVKRSDKLVTTAKRQIAPEAFTSMEVMHYSIPAVQELGTGAIENGEDIASAKQLIDGPVVLVSRLNPRKATICRAAPHGKLLTLASTEFVALKPTSGDIRFLEYLVSSELFRQRLDSWVQSVTRSHQRARPEEIYRFWNAWPEPGEQRAIADFLDGEIAKIDTLVASKRTLINRLKEKRTALISHTVTCGLPPDAASAAGLNAHPKLRPSGIDWLGDVPEHWEVKKLRYVGEAIIGLTFEPSDISNEVEGVLVLRASNVSDGRIVLEDNVFVSCEVPDRLITRVGDILICSRSGSRALIGKNALIDESAAGLTFGTFMTVFRSPTNSFLFYVFSSPLFDYQSGAFLTSTINQLTISNLYTFEVPLPPPVEQEAIASYLGEKTARIDAMIAKVMTAIDRLQEYRIALITAAVTGKIDVRGAAT